MRSPCAYFLYLANADQAEAQATKPAAVAFFSRPPLRSDGQCPRMKMSAVCVVLLIFGIRAGQHPLDALSKALDSIHLHPALGLAAQACTAACLAVR